MDIDRVGNGIGEHASQPASGGHFAMGKGGTVVDGKENRPDDEGDFGRTGGQVTIDEGRAKAFHSSDCIKRFISSV